MKNILLFMLLFIALNLCSGQTNKQFPIYHFAKGTSIDSLPNIRIDKLIYYKDPLTIENGILQENSFVPQWYEAFCAQFNYPYFKDYPNEAIKFYCKDLNITEVDLEKSIKAFNASKIWKQCSKYMYIYGEILFNSIKPNDRIIALLFVPDSIELKNFNGKVPFHSSEKYPKRIDSSEVASLLYLKYEDNLIKIPHQNYADSILAENHKYSIKGFLYGDFKKVCLRSSKYILSIKRDGKRVYETIKNTSSGTIIENTSDKP